MVNRRAQTGQQGETLAARHLENAGYTVLERNWRCRFGELDIIAQQADVIVFVEVKTRRTSGTDAAFAAMTPQKQQRLVRAVHLYLTETAREDAVWRVDVIAVALPDDAPPQIDHVEDALGW